MALFKRSRFLFTLSGKPRLAGVFDIEKLAWVNRHYLKTAEPERLARLSLPYLQREGWLREPTAADVDFLAYVVPAAASSVDRLEQVPARLAFLFDYSAARALEKPDIRAEAEGSKTVIAALARELQKSASLLDREAFRAMASRVRERTGEKGKALFHPIRLALTGEAEGLELDAAVPAIDRGAALADSSTLRIVGTRDRASAFARALSIGLE